MPVDGHGNDQRLHLQHVPRRRPGNLQQVPPVTRQSHRVGNIPAPHRRENPVAAGHPCPLAGRSAPHGHIQRTISKVRQGRLPWVPAQQIRLPVRDPRIVRVAPRPIDKILAPVVIRLDPVLRFPVIGQVVIVTVRQVSPKGGKILTRHHLPFTPRHLPGNL